MDTFRYLESLPSLSLDTDACVGCGNCVTVCPHQVFLIMGKKAVIADLGGCMECGGCRINCPVGAIRVKSGEGCGCATLLIKRWLAGVLGKDIPGSGCC